MFTTTTLLLEGPKFPNFNFYHSSLEKLSNDQDKRFTINNKPIYLFTSNNNDNEGNIKDEGIEGSLELDHTVTTSKSVWDSCLILSKFFEKQVRSNKLSFHNKSVIELGSGKSIPSITIAMLGVNKLIITDMPSVIPEIKEITKLNNLNEKNISVKPLNWINRKEDLPLLIDDNHNRPWDYIIASDIVWVNYLIEPLIETLNDLTTPKHTTLFIAHQKRTTRSDNLFFDGLKNHNWIIEKIDSDDLNWEEGFCKYGVEIYKGIKYQ